MQPEVHHIRWPALISVSLIMGSSGKMVLYCLALASTCLPPAGVIIFFSQLSPLSPSVLLFLSSPAAKFHGINMHHFLVLLATLGMATVLAAGRGKAGVINATWRWWTPWWGFLALGLVSAILAVPYYPCFAVGLLSASGCMVMFALRRVCFQEEEATLWFQVASLAFSCAALGCLAVWFTWIAVGFPGRRNWTDWSDAFVFLVDQKQISWKMSFVAWSAPLAIAIQLGLAALLCWMRGQHNLLHDRVGDSDGRPNNTWIISSVKQLSAWIAAFVLLAWLHAALSATLESQYDQERADLRDEVLGLGFIVLNVVFFWTADTLGPAEVQSAARDSKVVQETQKMLEGDWSKAAGLLVGALPMCAFALVDAFERRLGIQKERPMLWFVKNWCWTSVIVKAVWLGMLYIGLAVGFAKFTSVLLALINESLVGWPVFPVSAAMFAIGFCIFLLPPAPGPPIYVVMGIVIVSCALGQGWTFGQALAWATCTAFTMKLAFTFAAQKFIGEPLSRDETIRGWCELHKPYMRAMESILQKEGLTVAKVTLLVGGPDWPVAVLCGILRLPPWQVQLGTSPVLLQSVFPCVLAGALMLTRSEDDRKSFGMAEVTLAIAGVIQAASAAVAFFHVQETLECKYDELSQPREEDSKLVELEAWHDELNRCFWKELSWELLPCWIRSTLFLALFCMEVSVLLLTGPWDKLIGRSCFKTFGLQSSVAKDLHGNPFAIMRPLGWVALAFATLSATLLVIFYTYAKNRVSKDQEESAPLIVDGRAAL